MAVTALAASVASSTIVSWIRLPPTVLVPLVAYWSPSLSPWMYSAPYAERSPVRE